MPKTAFSSRAAPEYAALNEVQETTGFDALAQAGVDPSTPAQEIDPRCATPGLDGLKDRYDLIVVGAGLSGAVLAEQCAKLGLTSLVLDKREHIGGNCYDYTEEHGIRVSKYGAHLFHTKFDRVKEYVKQFSEWIPYEHRVVGFVAGKDGEKKLVPIPPNQKSINELGFTDTEIKGEEDMQAWYDKVRVAPPSGEPQNGEEAALSRVGPDLYEAVFKHYTKKQWDKYPNELDASVLMRLPCRTTTDDRYFPDEWQALPVHGYTRIFENMLLKNDLIDIRLGVDFFEVRDKLPAHGLLVYTGPIDSYYAAQNLPKLEYRSIRFEEEYLPEPSSDGPFFQDAMVVNYPGADVKFTRIIEYKHVPNQTQAVKDGKVSGTVICHEYSTAEGDPYYPVPNQANRDLYEKYREMAEKEEGVAFVGRLASYKYFNMDQAILNALEMFDQLRADGKLGKQ